MRDFVDGILTFIGTATLTDGEEATIQLPEYGYDQETYDQIRIILGLRESISQFDEKLIAYFKAKGVDVTSPQASGSSNIFVGGCL